MASTLSAEPTITASQSASSLQVRLIEDNYELQAIESQWRDLVQRCPWRNPCLEPDFLLPMLAHRNDRNVQTLVVEETTGTQPARLHAIFPIASTRFYRLPIRCVEIWKPDEFFDTTPLVDAERATESLDQAITYLQSQGNQLFSLNTVSAGDSFGSLLDQIQQDRGLASFQRDKFSRAAITPAETADEYLKGLSKNRRKKSRQLLRRLEKLGTVEFSYTLDPTEVVAWAEDFVDLEASGWKGEQDTAIASRKETLRCFVDVVQRMADRESIKFAKLTLDQRPIAMLVDFISDHHISAYKTCYDERLAEYSPGYLLEFENIRFMHESSNIQLCDSCTDPNNALINAIYRERVEFQSLVLSLNQCSNPIVRWVLPAIQQTANRIRSFRK